VVVRGAAQSDGADVGEFHGDCGAAFPGRHGVQAV
jgi:hypothetical protein